MNIIDHPATKQNSAARVFTLPLRPYAVVAIDSLNPTHVEAVEEYLIDLAECAAYAKAHPELKNEGNAAMYGMVAKIPG